jgi:hypothetical protein
MREKLDPHRRLQKRPLEAAAGNGEAALDLGEEMAFDRPEVDREN